MKILMLSDEADPMLWEYLDKRRLEGVELILSCGDLSARYLSFLTCFTVAPIVYVPGNHDARYEKEPPEGCICADDDILEINGVRILGLGGCMRYKPGPYMYTEDEMRSRVSRLRFKLWRMGGFDILLTHAPMHGYGDLEDLPHRGFDCFRDLLDRYRPKLFAFGHVHQCYKHDMKRVQQYNDTMCVNAFKSYTVEIDFPERQHRRGLRLHRKS